MEAEALVSEPNDYSTALLCLEWIRARHFDTGRSGTDERVMSDDPIDFACVAPHRLEAAGEDALDVLE